MSFLRTVFDDRFLMHRLKSTSTAGIATAVLAIVVFEYRLLRYHVWDWTLLAFGATFAVIKMTLMTWYYLTD